MPLTSTFSVWTHTAALGALYARPTSRHGRRRNWQAEAQANPQLFGFSVASGLSLYYLQQESKVASGLLLASVEELQLGTGKARSSTI